MNYSNLNFKEEIKKQNSNSDYSQKNFTNNQNNSMIKGANSLNKNSGLTPRQNENKQTVTKNYEQLNVQKGADYLNNSATVKSQTVKQPTVKTENYNQIIPKEKKEQQRLLKLTGTYDLKKADQNEIRKHIKLKEKNLMIITDMTAIWTLKNQIDD